MASNNPTDSLASFFYFMIGHISYRKGRHLCLKNVYLLVYFNMSINLTITLYNCMIGHIPGERWTCLTEEHIFRSILLYSVNQSIIYLASLYYFMKAKIKKLKSHVYVILNIKIHLKIISGLFIEWHYISIQSHNFQFMICH